MEEYGDIDIGITKMSEVIGFSKLPSENYTLSINVCIKCCSTDEINCML